MYKNISDRYKTSQHKTPSKKHITDVEILVGFDCGYFTHVIDTFSSIMHGLTAPEKNNTVTINNCVKQFSNHRVNNQWLFSSGIFAA